MLVVIAIVVSQQDLLRLDFLALLEFFVFAGFCTAGRVIQDGLLAKFIISWKQLCFIAKEVCDFYGVIASRDFIIFVSNRLLL